VNRNFLTMLNTFDIDPFVVSMDIPIGAMQACEYHAKYLGDWAIQFNKSHHTMNAMGRLK